jgi:MFS family permease
MTESSTWTALRNPAFRRLWIATVISGTCVAAHNSAAPWMMNVVTGSPFLISLMASVASLPFFLFTLPAGVLADKVNRQKFVCAINLWLAAIAVGLAVLGWLHLLNPVLARNFLFALFISVIPALMPVVGLQVLHLGSSQLGLLFTSMGAGSVFGAVFVISWLRARFSPDSVTLAANLLIVLAYMLMAFVRQAEVFFVVAALAGVGWTLSASELWVAAQRAMPSWARGRMNATVIMISQAAMVFGGVIWSSAAPSKV